MSRYCHAFTWLATGCGLGLGWIWDLFELPNYVEEASRIDDYIRSNSSGGISPRCSTVRFLGQLLLGYWLGQLTLLALPLFLWEFFVGCFIGSVVVALGVAWGRKLKTFRIIMKFGHFQVFMWWETLVFNKDPLGWPLWLRGSPVF